MKTREQETKERQIMMPLILNCSKSFTGAHWLDFHDPKKPVHMRNIIYCKIIHKKTCRDKNNVFLVKKNKIPKKKCVFGADRRHPIGNHSLGCCSPRVCLAALGRQAWTSNQLCSQITEVWLDAQPFWKSLLL